jgi:quinol monooxygenase YgiN
MLTSLEIAMHRLIPATLVTVLCVAALLAPQGAALAADEKIIVVGRFTVAPGRENDIEARFKKLVAFVRQVEPNVTYHAYRSTKDPALFVLYEVYPSEAAREEHMKVHLPAFQKENGPLQESWLTRSPERDFLRVVADQ